MQPRAAHRSREHSYLVASRDGRCDNDDSFVVTYPLHALGKLCYGSGSGSRDVCLVVREGAVCLVALRDGRCDNDDATFDNFRSYILGGRVAVIGEAEVAACRCRSREHS